MKMIVLGAGGQEDLLDDDVGVYDTSKDWSQATILAKQMPDKLRELQRLWLIEATRYNVLPLMIGLREDESQVPLVARADETHSDPWHGVTVGKTVSEYQRTSHTRLPPYQLETFVRKA